MTIKLPKKYVLRALPDLGDNFFGGLLVAFTGPNKRDKYGQYFTNRSDLGFDILSPEVPRPLDFHHKLSGVNGTIGHLRSFEVRQDGLYAVGELDPTHAGYAWIKQDLDAGKLGFSAETVPAHMAVGSDGHVDKFPIFGGALSAAPSAPEGLTKVSVLRGMGLEVDGDDDANIYTTSRSVWDYEWNEAPSVPSPPAREQVPGVMPQVPYSQVQVPALRSLPQNGNGNGHHQTLRATDTPPLPDVAGEQGMSINGMKDAVEQAGLGKSLGWYVAAKTGTAGKARGIEFPDTEESFLRSLMGLVVKEFQQDEQKQESAFLRAHVYVDPRTGELKKLPSDWDILSRHFTKVTGREYSEASVLRADELVYSTQASYGDEWVFDAWSMQIWRDIRLTSRVFSLFQSFNMPSQTFEYPVIDNPTYAPRVLETTNQSQLSLTATPYTLEKFGTSSKTFNIPAKWGKMYVWSMEFRKWANVDWMAAAQAHMFEALWRTADFVCLFGDERDLDDNIGYYSAAGNTPSADGKTWLLNLDGLVHHCLVTATGQSNDNAAAALSESHFDNGRTLMDPLGLEPEHVIHITNSAVGHKARSLTNLETVEKAGQAYATILNGQVQRIYASPVVVPLDFPKTDGDGKINQTGGSNTQSAILSVDPRTILIGKGWDISIESVPVPGSDAQYLKGNMAFDLQVMQENGVSYEYDITA